MHRKKLRAALAAVVVVGATVAVASVTGEASAAGAVLVVNAATPFRPVSHLAAGGLYGLAENNRPSDAMLLPLKINTLTQPAPGVGQRPNGQPPGGDSLLVAPQANRVGGAEYIRMPDIYPSFPYGWVSWSDWNSKVDTMVNKRLAATTVSNITGWELWNEPDWTWNSAAGSFNAGWVTTFRRVRALDTLTPIVGPSISYYNESWMRSFLTYARDNNALPDIICWHELSGSSRIASDIANYRALESSLGISARRISINEYATTAEIDQPGSVASYIAKLERGGVDNAARAFWYEYGTMNGLTTSSSQPTGSYWLYKWYGEMAGNMVTTVPPSQSGLDGFASFDPTRKIVNIALGAGSGTNSVQVTGLSGLGSSVSVRIESTPANGRATAVSAPTTVSTSTASVSGGTVTVSVPNMVTSSAYHVVLQPTSGVPSYQQRYEAENASIFRANRVTGTSASAGSYVGQIDNTGNPRTASYLDFIVNVPTARAYPVRIGYANGTGATSTQGIAVNSGGWSTVSYPATSGWGVFGTVNTTVTLNAGYNVIRLAKGSPNFAGGTGYAELDYLELDPGTTTPTSAPPTTTAPTTRPPTSSAPTSSVPTSSIPTSAGPTSPPPTSSVPTSAGPTGSASCTVAYSITNQWPGGFQGDVVITNRGTAAINGWNLQWTFPNGQTIGQAWNATATQSGSTVNAINVGWNATIAAGGTAGFGFTANWTGSNSEPGAFTLNGSTCSVG